MMLSPTGRTTPLDQESIIRITNQFRSNHPQLTESNFEAMMERADVLSRQRLHQPLGPFWLIGDDAPYDTPYSGWASLQRALNESRSEAAD